MTTAPGPWTNASRLKTRHLMLLLHLHEHGSVLRAAEAAAMTQPAASKLLAEMEDMLGVKLFERHARGVEPTWYGHVLIRRARSAMSEIGRATEEIAALRSGHRGQVSIGTVVNPGTNLVPQAIAEVKREFPDILIRVEMDYSRPLVVRLLDGQLDLVIGRILGPEGAADLAFEALADEPHSVIARAGHPLANRDDLHHADLARHGWILPPADSVLRARLDALFLEQGLPIPQNIIETSSLPVMTSLLRGSDLLAALPVESVAPYIQAKLLTVLPIDVGVRMESFGIIYRRGHVLPPAAERMLLALRTTARWLYPGLRGSG
ncbi:LysR substrate-binding domain-containing protein [Stenotrophomonas sp. RG-453]|uniref:LysR substrate-binding domain-containing protein n=1 Tax=Stenotrophomonas sp. RG-453 TaxID=2957502 RepID=UPI0029CA9355|nr:LysR substrate-binding domain-containing protein [Stenotrophomonas sp. RG-453]MDX5515522.1 LysR substrate-binding domain-containing protein [Stenotrophomonas sp. RG-453]